MRAFICLAIAIGLATIVACNSQAKPAGSLASSANCLPNLELTDQRSQPVNLASLRGSLVLFDFIYTSCPGPCEVMTQRMAKVAEHLGSDFGKKVKFVSVTIDPEHDGPPQLAIYAKAQGANRDGWLFLTGSPEQVTALLSAFKLERVRQADGSIDHVLAFFLVRGDGVLQGEYSSGHTRPEAIAEDIRRLINHG